MLTFREIMQGADPWVSIASTLLLVQSYQGLLKRLAYIGLLFYWTTYISKDNLFYTQILTELLRSKSAKGGETDDLGKHWTLNIAEIFLLAGYGQLSIYFFPGHKWKSFGFATLLNLFVFRHNVFELWTQTWIASLVRLNGNIWRWRDWVIDITVLSLLRKLDCQRTQTIYKIFWWSLHKILIVLCTRAVGDQLAACLLIFIMAPETSHIKTVAKWAQRALLCRWFLENLVSFANPNPKKYKYSPLKDKEDIRVILLYPRLGFGKICCSLQQGPIMSSLFYEAISYNWGTMDATEEILVDGCTMKVTKSVYEILNTYSSLFVPRLLWIDAICIDQNSDAEKSQQVPLMERIYLNAVFTTVFLGRAPLAEYPNQQNRTPDVLSIPYRYDSLCSPDEKSRLHFEDTQLTFDLLKEFRVHEGKALRGSEMRAYQLFEALQLSKRKQRQWAALLKMLQHPWFSRVWVIQEVALSSSVRLRYGDEIINWETLAAGIKKLDDARHFQLWLEVQHGVQLSNLQHSSLYNIERINQFRDKHRPRGWDDYDSSYWETFDLSKVLAHGSYFQATNPRDLIFGLMSLCSKPLKVDYSLSVEAVYLDAAKRLIEDKATGLLFHASGIGNRPADTPTSLNLPSWVPNWQETPRYDRLRNQTSWKQTDFRAGGESKPCISLECDNKLKLSGHFIDTIAHVGPLLFDPTRHSGQGTMIELHHLARSYETCIHLVEQTSCIPNSYTFDASSPSPSLLDPTSPQTSLEAFHRTLFLDRKWINWGTKVADFYTLFLEWETNIRSLASPVVERDMPVLKKNPLYEWLKGMHTVTEKVRSSCGGRRFFVTEKGYMGLCPPYAEEGDCVVVVPGLHVPLLLRGQYGGRRRDSVALGDDNGGRETGGRFQLVGECYVNGLMNGEGLSIGSAVEEVEII